MITYTSFDTTLRTIANMHGIDMFFFLTGMTQIDLLIVRKWVTMVWNDGAVDLCHLCFFFKHPHHSEGGVNVLRSWWWWVVVFVNLEPVDLPCFLHLLCVPKLALWLNHTLQLSRPRLFRFWSLTLSKRHWEQKNAKKSPSRFACTPLCFLKLMTG